MADEIRINGVQHSWSSVKLKIEGEPYTGVTSISYGDAIEVVKAYGMARHHAPRGRSAGKYTPDPVAMSMFVGSARALREQMAALSPSGNSFGRAVFTMTLQYIELDESPVTVLFEDCRLTKFSSSHDESPDALTEDVEIDVLRIRRNGFVLYDDRNG